MKKIPSSGFVYLVFIALVTLWFFSWIISEGWYDRIYTISQTNKDFKKQADYLVSVAQNVKRKSLQEERLCKAGSLYVRIGDKKNACKIYRRLTELAPDNNTYLSRLTSLLYGETKNRTEVITNIKKLYKTMEENGHVDENMLKVLLAQVFEGDREINKHKVLGLIFSGEYPSFCTLIEGCNIALCNLTPDRWSTNMEPFFIVVKNPQDKVRQIELELGCWPSSRFTSIVAEIKGIDFKKQVVFNKKNKFHTIKLTTPPHEVSLFKGTTDKIWRAPNDPRKLGVNVHSVAVVENATTSITDEH